MIVGVEHRWPGDPGGAGDLGEGALLVVTGASGLLGREVVFVATKRGDQVVGLDLQTDSNDVLACDVTDRSTLQTTLRRVASRYGAVGKVVHCAATNDPVEGPRVSWDDREGFMDVLETNILGTVNVIEESAAIMADRSQRGAITVIASHYAHVAPDPRLYADSDVPDKSLAYVASKAALPGVIRHLAVRWAPYGVRINGLSPGGIQSTQAAQFVSSYSARVPVGRMATTREIADIALDICSDSWGYLVGETVVADGGYRAW